MPDVFISHAEEDADLALRIALDLEKEGYSTWCYEKDSVGGLSQLIQENDAIQQCQCLLLIISPASCASYEVDKEVVVAHQRRKAFIPVLWGLSHADWQERKPEWRVAVGAAVSISLKAAGASEDLRRIWEGLNALGIRPQAQPSEEHRKALQERLDKLRRHGARVSRLARPYDVIKKTIPARAVATSLVVGVALLMVAFVLWRYLPRPIGPVVVGVMDFEAVQLGHEDEWMPENTRDGLNAILSKVGPDQLSLYSKERIELERKKKKLTPIEAAESLGIRKMISGKVSTSGSELVLEVRIVDIWSGLLEPVISRKGPKNELIGLQNEAAGELLGVLHITLSPEKKNLLFASRTKETLEGYKLLTNTLGAYSEEDRPTSPRSMSPQRSVAFAWAARIAYAQDAVGAEKTEIAELLQQYRVALETRSFDRLTELQFEELNERQREPLRSYFAYAADLHVQISDVDIVVEGDDALATFTRTDQFTEVPTGRPVHLEVRVSSLLAKKDGRWKIRGFKHPS